MDMGTLRGLIAAVTMATFFGICWWAYRGRNRARFEEDGRLPFGDDAAAARAVRRARAVGDRS